MPHRAGASETPLRMNRSIREGDATSLSADLSLRGAAAWDVTVQAVRSGGGRGNASAAQRGTPPDPVVLGGKPNGVAQVGKLWAFQRKEDRCVTRTFNVSAYAKGFAPSGPARGFQVTPNVLRPRGGRRLVTIRAQGIDATPVVKIDGKVVHGVRRVNTGTIEFKAPKLSKGAHEVSLKIGADALERKPGALVVV